MSVKRALLMSTGDRYILVLLHFATTALVSRILTPEEIGVAVIGMATVAIAMSLREFSSANFLIQRKELSHEDIRGAFTVLFILTCGITAVIVGASPFIASFYGEPNLVPFFSVIAACLFLDTALVIITALLRREMSFGKVAAINITGAAAGSVAKIVLAVLGYSYMSFAWAWLIGSSLATVFAIVLRPHFWMFRPSFRNWRGIIWFGGYNGGVALLYRIFDALPFLLLGRLESPHAAAVFSRTLMIGQIPHKLVLGGAVAVVLPAFSAERRQGMELQRPYLTALSIVTVFHWPALLLLSVLAYPVVDIVLGDQWSEAAPLVQVVSIALLFSFSFELNYPVLVAMGAIRDLFIRALIVFPISGGILATAAILGGLHATVWCMLVTLPFQAYVALSFVRRRLGLRHRDIAAALWKSAIVAIASVAAPLFGIILPNSSFALSFGQAFGAVSLAMAAWASAVLLTRHPLLDEMITTVQALRRYRLHPAE